jgi:hypothetical protein
VEGDKDCYPLRRNTSKTANGWVLLLFFVDMRYACGTLSPLPLTALLLVVVDAAVPAKAAAHAQASLPLRVSTPALPRVPAPSGSLHARVSPRPRQNASDGAAPEKPSWLLETSRGHGCPRHPRQQVVYTGVA